MTTVAQIPAAQYLRVSTEHQRYSLDNQRDFISRYAAGHGFSVVRTYTDQAKSGLMLNNRTGLRELLHDVMQQGNVYRAILVYDISRWGRFQDIDEAGHYEFLCTCSGVSVHYCAENFVNDGSFASLLMKAIKRSMAGEYSRELGLKTSAGQKRVAALGFRVGGSAGYGLRRLLVSDDRRPKQWLNRGDRKNLATDRVILVPGPADEVACVRHIYRMLIDRGMTFVAIADTLNREGVPRPQSPCWTHHQVRAILTNPKYSGTVVYGRVSKRLGRQETRVPSTQWVVTPRAFEPVIDDLTYAAAQQVLANRTTHKPDEQLLDELRSILQKNGKLTAQLIQSTKGATPPNSYRPRFGSLARAYQLIGYQMSNARNIETRRLIQTVRLGLMQELQRLFPETISIEGRTGYYRKRLKLKNSDEISVRACFCFKTASGQLRWRIKSPTAEDGFTILLILMNPGSGSYRDLHLLPPMTLPPTLDVASNSYLLRISKRVPIPEAFLDVLNGIQRNCFSIPAGVKLAPSVLRRAAEPQQIC